MFWQKWTVASWQIGWDVVVHKLRHAADLAKDTVQQPFGTIEGATVKLPKTDIYIYDKHAEDGSYVEIEMIWNDFKMVFHVMMYQDVFPRLSCEMWKPSYLISLQNQIKVGCWTKVGAKVSNGSIPATWQNMRGIGKCNISWLSEESLSDQ